MLPSKYSISARPSAPVRITSPSRRVWPSAAAAKGPWPARWISTVPSWRWNVANCLDWAGPAVRTRYVATAAPTRRRIEPARMPRLARAVVGFLPRGGSTVCAWLIPLPPAVRRTTDSTSLAPSREGRSPERPGSSGSDHGPPAAEGPSVASTIRRRFRQAAPRATMKLRTARTSARGPHRNRSHLLEEAKFISEPRDRTPTKAQVPQRAIADGISGTSTPPRARTTRAAISQNTVAAALATRSPAGSRPERRPPHAASPKGAPTARASWKAAIRSRPAAVISAGVRIEGPLSWLGEGKDRVGERVRTSDGHGDATVSGPSARGSRGAGGERLRHAGPAGGRGHRAVRADPGIGPADHRPRLGGPGQARHRPSPPSPQRAAVLHRGGPAGPRRRAQWDHRAHGHRRRGPVHRRPPGDAALGVEPRRR